MNAPQHISDLLASTPKLDWRLWASPLDVVGDPTMTTEEKRSLLASWASDARSVQNYPALRQLETGHLVTIDAVIAALKKLDTIGQRDLAPVAETNRAGRRPRRGHWTRLSRFRRRPGDDDDGPSSPAPAGVLGPRTPPMGEPALAA